MSTTIVSAGSDSAGPDSAGPDSAGPTTSSERIGTLRGAGVAAVDTRRLGAIAVGLCVATLAALTVTLFAAGAHKNAQIANLRDHGVTVTMTVTGCTGLLGGSGSNAAGYACRGVYLLDGHRYVEAIPGTILRPPGSTVAAVTVAGDPHLVSTAAQVSAEHPSAGVYIVPAILATLLVALITVLVVFRHRGRRNGPGAPQTAISPAD